jgi:hypothetical protein
MTRYHQYLLLTFFLVAAGKSANAQQTKATPYYPTHAEVLQNYKTADALDSALKKIPLVTGIRPNWQAGGNEFWYGKKIAGNLTAYFLVNPEKGTKKTIFESSQLSNEVSKATGKPVKDGSFKIDDMFFSADKKQATFKTGNTWFKCDLGTLQCSKTTDTVHQSYDNDKPLQERHYRWEGVNADSISPDKQWTAFVKGGNIIVKSLKNSTEIKLTTDGNLDKPYGELTWSPDNKHLVGYRIDPKKTKEVYYLLSSVPGTTRAVLKSHEYDQPGDEFTSYQQYIFNIADKSALKTDAEKIDFFGAPRLHWRDGNSRYFTFEKADRGHQRFQGD